MASSITWLHCNNCGALPFEKDNDISRFSIAGCGHVFCNECVSMSALSCFVCQHTPFYPRAIDSNLSPQLKSLFTPLHLVYRHVLERVQDVAAFQWAQFELSRAFLQQKEYTTLKSEQDNKSNAEINAELSEGIADLEACINYTQRLLSAVQNDGTLNSMISREVIDEGSRIPGDSKRQFGTSPVLRNTFEADESSSWSLQSVVHGNSRVERSHMLPPSDLFRDGGFPVGPRGCVAKTRSDGLVFVNVNDKSSVVVRPSSMKSSAASRQRNDAIAVETMSADDRGVGVEVGASRLPELVDCRNNTHCGTHRHSRRSRLTKNPYAILYSLKKLNIPISEAQHDALRHMAIRWARKRRFHQEEPDERCNISADF